MLSKVFPITKHNKFRLNAKIENDYRSIFMAIFTNLETFQIISFDLIN